MAQLLEALRYKPEGRGFDSHCCHWNFHWHNPSGRTMALGLTQPLTEMSTRNKLGSKGGRCVGLTILPSSVAECLEIWKPQTPGILRACNGIVFIEVTVCVVHYKCPKMPPPTSVHFATRVRRSRVVESSWNVMTHGDVLVGKWRGKLANWVGSQYPSHYLGTWCIQHYYRWCAHLGCQQSTELTPLLI